MFLAYFHYCHVKIPLIYLLIKSLTFRLAYMSNMFWCIIVFLRDCFKSFTTSYDVGLFQASSQREIYQSKHHWDKRTWYMKQWPDTFTLNLHWFEKIILKENITWLQNFDFCIDQSVCCGIAGHIHSSLKIIMEDYETDRNHGALVNLIFHNEIIFLTEALSFFCL